MMVCNQTVWLKREFSCIAYCPAIASIKNGIVTQATLRNGGEVGIKCRTDYTLVGPSKLTCIEGKWSGSLPSCKAPCPDPGVPSNGSRSGDDFRHAKSVDFTCKEKYELVGASTISCNNGKWTSKTPICKVPSCKDPGSPVHGRQSKVSNNFAVGGFVQFKCDKNYTLVGRGKLICQENKKWNVAMPMCLASCPDPGHPENGKTIGSVFDHNSVVEFECLGDCLLQGSSQATCSNGRWDQVLPTCRDCGTGIPLGMESGKIPDKSIKASSQKYQHPAHHGRLGGGTYWCSEEERSGFIQIDLPKKYKITGARIQLESKYNISVIVLKRQIFEEWATFHYEKPPSNQEVEQIASKHPFIAQSIRIRVLRRIKQSICLRAEVYGCGVPRGCIMRGSAILVKENGRYQRGIVGEYISGNSLEVYLFGNTRSRIVARSQLIPDEKPSIHELAIGKLVLVEDVASPGLIIEGKIEQIEDSVCTIKTNNKTWKSDLNTIRIIKISDFCS